MSFLKKIFGKKDPIDEMRQLHARRDWAGLRSLAGTLEYGSLDEELKVLVMGWTSEAGDALAAINLEEGAWALQTGNLLRAREDFQLASEQACSEALRERAEKALAALDSGKTASAIDETGDGPAIHAGCSQSCTSHNGPEQALQEMDLDDEGRLELLLATMPAELAARYTSAGREFRQAWLATQDGDEERALELFGQVPEAERNALYLFERGALMARCGRQQEARQDLQAALVIEPGLFPAFDALAEVLISTGRIDELEKNLKQSLAAGRFAGHCWARLAEIHAQRRELEAALTSGLKALDEGVTDANLYLLCAQLLEQVERFDEAEGLLMRIPGGGGCSGGVHPLLAEFWLRRRKNFDRALESFKGAMRQERDNPRWLLRISEVYLAKGWRKEAAEQIERLMQQGNLPEPLLTEVKAVADQLQKA